MKRLFQAEKKNPTLRWLGVVAILGLALAACAPAAPTATDTPVPTAGTTAVPTSVPVPTDTSAPVSTDTPVATAAPTMAATAAATALTVNVGQNATLGSILVDGAGKTLYKYANDTSGTSTCSASCLGNWPPLLASGPVTAGTGLDGAQFSTAMTTDGRTMVTYKGSPLYYYKGDQAAGDTNGNGIGGVWSVVAP